MQAIQNQQNLFPQNNLLEDYINDYIQVDSNSLDYLVEKNLSQNKKYIEEEIDLFLNEDVLNERSLIDVGFEKTVGFLTGKGKSLGQSAFKLAWRKVGPKFDIAYRGVIAKLIRTKGRKYAYEAKKIGDQHVKKFYDNYKKCHLVNQELALIVHKIGDLQRGDEKNAAKMLFSASFQTDKFEKHVNRLIQKTDSREIRAMGKQAISLSQQRISLLKSVNASISWLRDEMFRPLGIDIIEIETLAQQIKELGQDTVNKKKSETTTGAKNQSSVDDKSAGRNVRNLNTDVDKNPQAFNDRAVNDIYFHVKNTTNKNGDPKYNDSMIQKWYKEYESRLAKNKSENYNPEVFSNILNEYVLDKNIFEEDEKEELRKNLIKESKILLNETNKLIGYGLANRISPNSIISIINKFEEYEKSNHKHSDKFVYEHALDNLKRMNELFDNEMNYQIKSSNRDITIHYNTALYGECLLAYYHFILSVYELLTFIRKNPKEYVANNQNHQELALGTSNPFSNIVKKLNERFFHPVIQAVSGIRNQQEKHKLYITLVEINEDPILHNNHLDTHFNNKKDKDAWKKLLEFMWNHKDIFIESEGRKAAKKIRENSKLSQEYFNLVSTVGLHTVGRIDYDAEGKISDREYQKKIANIKENGKRRDERPEDNPKYQQSGYPGLFLQNPKNFSDWVCGNVITQAEKYLERISELKKYLEKELENKEAIGLKDIGFVEQNIHGKNQVVAKTYRLNKENKSGIDHLFKIFENIKKYGKIKNYGKGNQDNDGKYNDIEEYINAVKTAAIKIEELEKNKKHIETSQNDRALMSDEEESNEKQLSIELDIRHSEFIEDLMLFTLSSTEKKSLENPGMIFDLGKQRDKHKSYDADEMFTTQHPARSIHHYLRDVHSEHYKDEEKENKKDTNESFFDLTTFIENRFLVEAIIPGSASPSEKEIENQREKFREKKYDDEVQNKKAQSGAQDKKRTEEIIVFWNRAVRASDVIKNKHNSADRNEQKSVFDNAIYCINAIRALCKILFNVQGADNKVRVDFGAKMMRLLNEYEHLFKLQMKKKDDQHQDVELQKKEIRNIFTDDILSTITQLAERDELVLGRDRTAQKRLVDIIASLKLLIKTNDNNTEEINSDEGVDAIKDPEFIDALNTIKKYNHKQLKQHFKPNIFFFEQRLKNIKNIWSSEKKRASNLARSKDLQDHIKKIERKHSKTVSEEGTPEHHIFVGIIVRNQQNQFLLDGLNEGLSGLNSEMKAYLLSTIPEVTKQAFNAEFFWDVVEDQTPEDARSFILAYLNSMLPVDTYHHMIVHAKNNTNDKSKTFTEALSNYKHNNRIHFVFSNMKKLADDEEDDENESSEDDSHWDVFYEKEHKKNKNPEKNPDELEKKEDRDIDSLFNTSFNDLSKKEHAYAERYGKTIWNSVSKTMEQSSVFKKLVNKDQKIVAHQVLLDLHHALSSAGKLNAVQQTHFSKLFLLNNQTFFETKTRGYSSKEKLKDREDDIWKSLEDINPNTAYNQLPDKVRDLISKETYMQTFKIVNNTSNSKSMTSNQRKSYAHLMTSLGSNLERSVDHKFSSQQRNQIMSEFGKRISKYVQHMLREHTEIPENAEILTERVANIRWRRNPRTHLNKVVMTCKQGEYKKSLNKQLKIAGQTVKEVMCLPKTSKPAIDKAKDRKSAVKRWRKIKSNPGKMSRSNLKRKFTKKFSKTLR